MIKEKRGIQWEGNNKRSRAKEDLTQEKETKNLFCITTDKRYDELELWKKGEPQHGTYK